MGDPGTTPRWDEVGDRFTQLGRTLQGRWAEQREEAGDAGDAAADEVRQAIEAGLAESQADQTVPVEDVRVKPLQIDVIAVLHGAQQL